MKEFTETELANEQWRDVDGYDGMYQVSDLGRVRSLKFGKTRVLRAKKTPKGYLQVCLHRDGKQNTVSVHRIVAQAFIPNDDESKTQINHRNEDKTENKVSNLEWCSAQYNNTYNDIHWRRKTSKRRKIKDLYRPDLSIQKNIELLKEQGIDCSQPTISKLRRDLGIEKYQRKTKTY